MKKQKVLEMEAVLNKGAAAPPPAPEARGRLEPQPEQKRAPKQGTPPAPDSQDSGDSATDEEEEYKALKRLRILKRQKRLKRRAMMLQHLEEFDSDDSDFLQPQSAQYRQARVAPVPTAPVMTQQQAQTLARQRALDAKRASLMSAVFG